MTEPLKEQSRMIAKELSWKPTEREELIEIIDKWLLNNGIPEGWQYEEEPDDLANKILEWHNSKIEERLSFQEAVSLVNKLFAELKERK
jgi:hypothetical protein